MQTLPYTLYEEPLFYGDCHKKWHVHGLNIPTVLSMLLLTIPPLEKKLQTEETKSSRAFLYSKRDEISQWIFF